jgi:hypothetical protein
MAGLEARNKVGVSESDHRQRSDFNAKTYEEKEEIKKKK